MQPSNSGAQGSNQQRPNPALEYYQRWSERTPYITRVTTIGTVVVWLSSFFIPVSLLLANVPQYTLFYFQIWRLLLSPLAGNSILTVLLVILMYPPMGSRLEWALGSSGFLYLLALMGLTVNIAFVLICLSLSFVGVSAALYLSCAGFWTILFALFTMQCLQTPEQPQRLFCIPVDIPSKYMPLVLYLLFSLFSGPELAFAISIGVGYLNFSGYLDKLKPSSYYYEELESSVGMLHSLSRSPGWVLAGAALGHDAWIPVNQQQQAGGGGWGSSAPQQQQQQQQQQGGAGNLFGSFMGQQQGGGGGASGENTKELFPGSGHTLTASGGSNSGSRGITSATSRSTADSALSREEVTARRLAALGGAANSGSNSAV